VTPTLGKIIWRLDEPATRDAVHVAIAPVVAGEALLPGTHVGLDADGKAIKTGSHIGIVDPFLANPVSAGGRFWLLLYPNSITSLRHDWSHPAFPSGDQKTDARTWIEWWAIQLDQSYESLMKAADLWVEAGEYTQSYKEVDYDLWPVFWGHYEKLTGRRPKSMEDTFFTCSC
jgi:hypothetical protein